MVVVWRSGNALVLQSGQPTLSPVSTGMGDRVRVRLPGVGTLFLYVTSHPGRLSLLPSMER